MMSHSNNEPKVSVIIPVYNVKAYLNDALKSVINQSYENLEIIVVDDGSSDGSGEICDEYAQKDERIKVIHQKNGGLSAARNTGLDNMSGEYIAFLDSDDLYHPEMIKKMLSPILQNNVDCTICKHITFTNEKNIKFKNVEIENNGKLYSKIELMKAVANDKIGSYAWNKLYKKDLFDNIRYPIGQNYEDIYIVFKIFDNVKNVFVLDEELVFYRNHPESIISTYSLKNFQDLHKAHKYFEQYIENHIPDIFTKRELMKVRNNWLNLLIYKYAQILHMNIPEKNELLIWFKENIREQNTENMKEYTLETRLIYYLMFNIPRLFSFCAMFYPIIRKFIFQHFKNIIQRLLK